MSAPRPEDQSTPHALRAPLEAWLNQQNQTLLEEVIATWQDAMGRFRPDAALLEQLCQAAAPSLAPASEGLPPAFATALDLVEGATSQSDLLRRLLDGLSPLVERSALFILKQGLASLYAHRGFEANAPLKPGAVVPPSDLEAVIQGLGRSLRKKGPGYSALLSVLSSYEAGDLAILPLRHKRKAVALLLVDSGLRQKLDHPDLVRALVLAASASLASLASGKEEPSHPEPSPAATQSSAPTQMVPDPIEPHAALDLDPKTRAAAERLARVLVGDVELYFPGKVAQARSQGNLYGLLRDELDRSRSTFVERFGEETESQHRIFTNTVLHLLCDDDASKLGRAPWA
jgi:hypothetical protein